MVIGAVSTINQRSRFVVEIDGMDGEIGFSKAGPIGIEITGLEYRGGGRMTPHIEAGNGKFKPITFELGSTTSDEIYQWLLDILDAIANSGLNTGYKRDVTITQLDREGLPLVYWRLYGLFLTDITLGDWDSDADEFMVESMEGMYENFEREDA